jgi:competence ComEA-like helix-hairpin-helix protein
MNRLVRLAVIFAALQLAIVDLSARSPWVLLQNCHYLAKRANDGDSFHVSVNGKEYIFRLYFVDAPETDSQFRDRIEEQAKYFGITVYQAVTLGGLAKAYTREKLSSAFEIRTCWEDAMGRSRLARFYAIVQTATGDLGEQLVGNGLAGIHGVQASPEGLTSARQEWQKLTVLERKAKREKVGGWGVADGRMAVRSQNLESGKGMDPFDAFFHPEKTAQNGRSPSTSAAGPPAANQSTGPGATPVSRLNNGSIETKLDVNTASEAELENLPGVGPVLAERIIAARPFKSADDLRNVKGIGDKKYEKLRPLFN